MKTDNELIAEFMGEVVFQKRPRHYIGVTETMKPYKLADKLKYHASWDWLMPACKKWDDLPIIDPDKQCQLCDELDHLVSCYEIGPAYLKLIECIKWYNQTKKP